MCETSDAINMNVVSLKDIHDLLAHFAKNTYKTKEADPFSSLAMQKCIELMKLDYSLFTVSNANGELCGQYPSHLVVLEYENSTFSGLPKSTDTIYENLLDAQKLRELFNKAKNARCRNRFPVPVIFYKGKYICRSATISGGPEIYGRSGLDYLFYGSDNWHNINPSKDVVPAQFDWQLFDKVRSQDINLLKSLNVATIVDFMVEKKKVKFGLNVTSSEKVDKENRYADFKLISLPYPGCEFFKMFRDNNYVGEGLVFDWSQSFVDAEIYVPEDPTSMQMQVDWNDYRSWDLIQMTQNYLKLILKYIQDNNSGILVHCISGWDRTPLFVSLIRLSLWADGLAHQSLDAQQIVYLTIAYDWMLFGHHLTDRFNKGEDIFYCCFNMLKYITKNEFSIAPVRHKSVKVEKVVFRLETESVPEEVLESDTAGSTASLNSAGSSASSKSTTNNDMVLKCIAEDFTNSYTLENYIRGIPNSVEGCATLAARSPQGRHTSPVSVPRLRQRQESLSSHSTDSWQLITGTGSLRGSDATSESTGHNTDTCSQDSNITITDDDLMTTYNNTHSPLNRSKRLSAVREIFLQSYGAAVGLKFKEGESPSFGAILGNIAEKVGFINN